MAISMRPVGPSPVYPVRPMARPVSYPPAVQATGYYAPAAPTGGGLVGAAGVGDGGFLGWVGGALVGAFWALPKLAKFGPGGIISSVIVVLGCGFYGSRVVGAATSALNGQIRPAVDVGAWYVGARLAAGAIAGMRQPGVLMAAFLIWLGSWAAGKVVSILWPGR